MIKILLYGAVSCAVVYLAIALLLIVSQNPKPTSGKSLDFSRAASAVGSANALPIKTYFARDGAKLAYRQLGTDTGPLIVVLHGSGAHGGLYLPLAQALGKHGTVLLPDLRGHGENRPRGDVSYSSQLEHDVADLVAEVNTGSKKVILVGHSSGGGLAIRYAGGDNPPVDGAILLAPYLKYNAPTTRPDSGGWAVPLTRRIIGLTMLNAVGISALNELTAITFRLPGNGEQLDMTAAYSYRLNTAYAPRNNYLADIAALPPFQIIVGSDDEAFHADQYSPLLESFDNNGEVTVVKGVKHLDIIHSEKAHAAIGSYLARFR